MVFYRMVNLPMRVRGFTIPDSDGNYNVYLNDRLSESALQKTIQHEQQHIFRGDCYKESSAYIIEKAL